MRSDKQLDVLAPVVGRMFLRHSARTRVLNKRTMRGAASSTTRRCATRRNSDELVDALQVLAQALSSLKVSVQAGATASRVCPAATPRRTGAASRWCLSSAIRAPGWSTPCGNRCGRRLGVLRKRIRAHRWDPDAHQLAVGPIAETWKESTRSFSRISPTALGGQASSSNIGVWCPTSRRKEVLPGLVRDGAADFVHAVQKTAEGRKSRVGGVERLGQHAAAEPARGLGKNPVGAGAETYIVTCALGEELPHRRALSSPADRAGAQQVTEFAQVPGVAWSVSVRRGGAASTSADHSRTGSWSRLAEAFDSFPFVPVFRIRLAAIRRDRRA